MMSPAPRIVLAAGGTGGHVFPAEALAEELIGRGYQLLLMTDRRGEAYGGALAKLETFSIRSSGIAGRGLLGRLRGLVNLGLGTIQAYSLLKKLQPAVVVGFGGYPSIPPMLAAIRAKIPTALHEQNAVLGRANRVLASRVGRIATSFKLVKGVPEGDQAVFTGMPVRPAVLKIADRPYPGLEGSFHILVTGGSQGASVFATVVPDALALLSDEVRARVVISQQCRPADLEQVKARYVELGIKADLQSFFTDVPERLAAAHLVIARAGASTLAEVTAAGRPAILVPYPHAIDDHQTANAHALDEVGGGWLMPQEAFTAESLAKRLTSLLDLPAALTKAAACAKAAGRPDAAARLADVVTGLIRREAA